MKAINFFHHIDLLEIFHHFYEPDEKIMVMVLITFGADLELAGIT